jgi:predicted AAA+ superfamily ATPase
MDKTPFKAAYQAAHHLLLFQNVLDDSLGRAFVELLELLQSESSLNSLQLKRLAQLYGLLFRELAQESVEAEQVLEQWWVQHLATRILDDANPLSAYSYKTAGKSSHALLEAARADLSKLQMLAAIVSSGKVEAEVKELIPHFNPIGWFSSVDDAASTGYDQLRLEMLRRFEPSSDWLAAGLDSALCDYYAQVGTDELARGRAFRWQRHGPTGDGYFEAIQQLDEARLENLIGYDRARAPLIQNTEQFLAGLPANNALLYGARGTGKSSTVKALLTRYGLEGLRLIEVHKNWLSDYALISARVRGRREKFILFVDDLSFEADEVVYKDLKALLEGSLEARPANLLIYATSNRRHLIKEQFSDNGRPEDTEISAWDTVEEKLSLSDRFGLTITFTPPNQAQYLAIVQALAEQAGLQVETAELERRALQWEMRHSGFSGRVARQFIDQLSGELQLKKI